MMSNQEYLEIMYEEDPQEFKDRLTRYNPATTKYLLKYPDELFTIAETLSFFKLKKRREDILEEALTLNKRVVFYASTQLHEEQGIYDYLFVTPDAKNIQLTDTIFGSPLTSTQQYALEEKAREMINGTAFYRKHGVIAINAFADYFRKYPEEQLHIMQISEALDEEGKRMLDEYIQDYVVDKPVKIRFRFDPDQGKIGMYVYDIIEVTECFWKLDIVVNFQRH